ncbi:MAG: 50S ribosome-binding GTPase [Gammaproteobacteria bacterium]|nr:50S ribosome-binding GTPase [Gammaproteobacteria bacterium]MCP5137281.1 50S ribosome-binding GTPase [Gammaproteobacteria bacterium]
MSLPLTPLRLLLALGLLLGTVLTILFALVLTDYALSVWERLQAAPTWLRIVYVNGIGLMLLFGLWLVWRLLRPTPIRATKTAPIPTEAGLHERVATLSEQGMDTASAERELQELGRRREAGEIHITLFGEINAGKSSLIRALLPDAVIDTSPRGGVTREITHYAWQRPSGDRLLLTDLPGLNEADGHLDDLAREEATRAHLVIYVCDGDLSRAQWGELSTLRALNKPLILALNKTDRYRADELDSLLERLRERIAGDPPVDLVTVSAGGNEELIRQTPDGGEERITRPRPIQIDALQTAIQARIDRDPKALAALRDSAIFALAAHKLDAEQTRHRRERAQSEIDAHTRKAVIAAMAAVAPGTDLLIQGYLGYSLIKSLCAIYAVPLREVDADTYLQMVTGRLKRTLPLMLAIAGNALKSFPGLGTLGGGVLHAIAYGLIFDSLGKAVRDTLESRGAFRPLPASKQFETHLGQHLDTSFSSGHARRIAELVFKQAREDARHRTP